MGKESDREEVTIHTPHFAPMRVLPLLPLAAMKVIFRRSVLCLTAMFQCGRLEEFYRISPKGVV